MSKERPIESRNTRQRDAIRAALTLANRPLSPEEIFAAAKSEVTGISLTTVYRNITALWHQNWHLTKTRGSQYASLYRRNLLKVMADREGFEPPVTLRLRLISSQVHSTGLCHLSV